MGHALLEDLAGTMVLGSLLDAVRDRWGSYELIDHWKQGEFHHDVVVRVASAGDELPGAILVVATNCNGGIKEVLSFAEPPERYALWSFRCPSNPDFEGDIPTLLGSARTPHWFDPCELLTDAARSELKAEFRTRQRGGGWMPKSRR
jgi:hypothetical protein